MKVRSLTAEEHDAFQAKGAQKAVDLLGALKDLPESQRFDTLCQHFKAAAKMLRSCDENFTGEEYTPRDCQNTVRSEEELVMLKQTAVCARQKLLDIYVAMYKSPLSRINETAILFAECTRELTILVPDVDLDALIMDADMPIPSRVATGYVPAYN